MITERIFQINHKLSTWLNENHTHIIKQLIEIKYFYNNFLRIQSNILINIKKINNQIHRIRKS